MMSVIILNVIILNVWPRHSGLEHFAFQIDGLPLQLIFMVE
jgi:hypothetical protein